MIILDKGTLTTILGRVCTTKGTKGSDTVNSYRSNKEQSIFGSMAQPEEAEIAEVNISTS